MSIIKSKQKHKRSQVRINIENPIMEKIKQYCEWANVEKLDDFFEQAAEFVLQKDPAWKNFSRKKEVEQVN